VSREKWCPERFLAWNFLAGAVLGEWSELSSGMGGPFLSGRGLIAPFERTKGAILEPHLRLWIWACSGRFTVGSSFCRAVLCRRKKYFSGIFSEVEFPSETILAEISGFSRRIGQKEFSIKPKGRTLSHGENRKARPPCRSLDHGLF
jgi:hypothetical protein